MTINNANHMTETYGATYPHIKIVSYFLSKMISLSFTHVVYKGTQKLSGNRCHLASKYKIRPADSKIA